MNNEEINSNNDSVQKTGWESVADMANKMGQIGVNPEALKTTTLKEFSDLIGVRFSAISDFFKKKSEVFREENGENAENPFVIERKKLGEGKRGSVLYITLEQQQYYLGEKIDTILKTREREELEQGKQEINTEPAPEGYITRRDLARETGMSDASVKFFFKGYDLQKYPDPRARGRVASFLSPEQQAEYKQFLAQRKSASSGNELTIQRLADELGGVKRAVIARALNKYAGYILDENGRKRIGKREILFTPEEYIRLKEKSIAYMNDKRRANRQESTISYYLSVANIKHERAYCPDWMKNEETGYNWEIDLYLPDHNMGIEYDGRKHKETLEKDYKKDQMALTNHGTRIFHVREPDLPEMKEGMLGVQRKNRHNEKSFSETLTELFSKMGIEIPGGVDVKRDAGNIDKVVEERLAFLNYGKVKAILDIADNTSEIQIAS